MNFLEAYEANKTKKVICLDNHDVFEIDKMRSETTWYVDHIEGKWQIVEEPKSKVVRWLWVNKNHKNISDYYHPAGILSDDWEILPWSRMEFDS